jgi:hypothetical protein
MWDSTARNAAFFGASRGAWKSRIEKGDWEAYAQSTFTAHAGVISPTKLRFMQYVQEGAQDWWPMRREQGAVLLGKPV